MRKVSCLIIDRSLQSRLGCDRSAFDERTALKLQEKGHVVLDDVVSTLGPSDLEYGDYDPSKPLIVWFEDQPGRPWGAEFSSDCVIKAGKKAGFQIHHMGQRNFSMGMLKAATLVILNNIAFIDEAQLRMLLMVLFEHGTPYIRYEHDAFFCVHRSPMCHGRLDSKDVRCKNCQNTKHHHYNRRMLMWKLFSGSLLNVFISPLQHKIHLRALGEVVNPCYYLTPPIDTDFFKPVAGIKRQGNLVVSMTGKIWYENKGLKNLLKYAVDHPEYRFDVYTKPNPQLLRPLMEQKNIMIKVPVPYDKLPAIYSSAKKVIHLPAWPEAAGRTVIEGLLCGCEVVLNDNCGVNHFDFPWSEPEKVREIIKVGPKKFWEVVDKVLSTRCAVG